MNKSKLNVNLSFTIFFHLFIIGFILIKKKKKNFNETEFGPAPLIWRPSTQTNEPYILI